MWWCDASRPPDVMARGQPPKPWAGVHLGCASERPQKCAGSWVQREGESPAQVAWGWPDPTALSGPAVVQIATGCPPHARTSDRRREKHTTKQKHLLEACDLPGETIRHSLDSGRWEGAHKMLSDCETDQPLKAGEGLRVLPVT